MFKTRVANLSQTRVTSLNGQETFVVPTTAATSWGSMAAAAGGVAGAVAPFVPPQYQWISALLAAILGTVATKLP